MKRLELERRCRDWTQTELAAAAGNGRALPSAAQLTRLANALRVPACGLLADIKDTEVRESP